VPTHLQIPGLTTVNTLFKIITSLIATKVEKFLTENQVLTEQQKFCQGCKEQLIIDTIVCKRKTQIFE
jgi:hypothetical protein